MLCHRREENLHYGAKIMRFAMRLVALLIVVPATYYFIYWVPFSLLKLDGYRWIASIVSLLVACSTGWFVWLKLGSVDQGFISSVLVGAVLLGGIGFSA